MCSFCGLGKLGDLHRLFCLLFWARPRPEEYFALVFINTFCWLQAAALFLFRELGRPVFLSRSGSPRPGVTKAKKHGLLTSMKVSASWSSDVCDTASSEQLPELSNERPGVKCLKRVDFASNHCTQFFSKFSGWRIFGFFKKAPQVHGSAPISSFFCCVGIIFVAGSKHSDLSNERPSYFCDEM